MLVRVLPPTMLISSFAHCDYSMRIPIWHPEIRIFVIICGCFVFWLWLGQLIKCRFTSVDVQPSTHSPAFVHKFLYFPHVLPILAIPLWCRPNNLNHVSNLDAQSWTMLRAVQSSSPTYATYANLALMQARHPEPVCGSQHPAPKPRGRYEAHPAHVGGIPQGRWRGTGHGTHPSAHAEHQATP